jgi:hypothetical protein
MHTMPSSPSTYPGGHPEEQKKLVVVIHLLRKLLPSLFLPQRTAFTTNQATAATEKTRLPSAMVMGAAPSTRMVTMVVIISSNPSPAPAYSAATTLATVDVAVPYSSRAMTIFLRRPTILMDVHRVSRKAAVDWQMV